MKRLIFALFLIFCASAIAGQPLRTNTATEIMVDLLDTSGDPVESLTTIGDLHIRLFTIAYDASTVTMAGEINPTADGGGVNDLVHEADGMWTFELAAANINFVGRLNVSISDPDNGDFVTWSKSFEVYSANIFDAQFGGDYQQVDVKQLDGSGIQQSSGYIKVSDGTGTGQINLDGGKIVEVSTLTNHTAQSGNTYALANNGTYGFSALEALVDDIGVAGAGLTNINLPNQTMDITGSLSGSVGSLTGHTNQTGDTYALANNGTYGFSALESLVDDLESRLTALRAGYLDELAPANLPADVDLILADSGELQTNQGNWATAISVTVSDKTGFSLSAAGIDSILDEVVEGSLTHRQAIRLIMAVLTGKSSGGGTSNIIFRDIGDTKNRLSVTVDSNGNRTAVGTRDGS